LDYIYLLSSFRHLDFKRFLNRIHIRQILNQRIQPAEVYFHLFFNRNKIYLDFFTKNKFVEACLKQAFIKFLLLQPLPPLKKLGMVINNKLIINKNHLKSLFASPSGSLVQPAQLQTKLVQVQSNIFTGDFLWKYRDHIYQPSYEEVVVVSQQMPPLEFQIVDMSQFYDKLFS